MFVCFFIYICTLYTITYKGYVYIQSIKTGNIALLSVGYYFVRSSLGAAKRKTCSTWGMHYRYGRSAIFYRLI